ncbi:hypothetical protein NUM3379_24100 [Kineococcus sp. NUM-3379]
MGDEVLAAFAQHLRAIVRPEDTAARLGGDEFAVLCEDTTAEQAALIGARLVEGLPRTGSRSAVDAGGGAPAVGVTVGIATSPDTAARPLSGERLLAAADTAMHRARTRRTR